MKHEELAEQIAWLGTEDLHKLVQELVTKYRVSSYLLRAELEDAS